MTATYNDAQALAERIDERFLVDRLTELCKVPTDVPLGPDTFVLPDHPKFVHYVQDVLRPMIQATGAYNIIDTPKNNLVVQMGEGTSDAALLLLVYVPTQHHQLMDRPFEPRIASGRDYGFDEPCLFAQGVGQNKSHHAVMLAVLKMLVEEKVRFPGTLYYAVNNEAMSSHGCSEAIIPALEHKPQFGILLNRTGLRISMGNRGRVDANIEVRAKTSHSSAPGEGINAIEGARRALDRLQQVPIEGTHPLLGGRHAVPYQMLFDPVAPHTLPGVARIRVDRRMLPGDDPDKAVADIRETIGDLSPYQVSVERGTYMLPALVDPDHPGVAALTRAHKAVCGSEPDRFYGHGSFDAGGPCALGVPSVMYGSGAGEFPLGIDFVPISQAVKEAKIVVHTMLSLLT